MNFKLLFVVVLLASACKSKIVHTSNLEMSKYIKEVASGAIETLDGKKITLSTNPGDKVIYLVRHAEKDTLPSKKNPILTDLGYQRSYNLAQLLMKTRIDAIYSTFYVRTMHTVDSLATAKGLPTKIYQPKEMKGIAEKIEADPNIQTAIISGHSNTTPAFANLLMGKKEFETGFDESDYDNFLVVNILKNGERKLYKLKYQ